MRRVAPAVALAVLLGACRSAPSEAGGPAPSRIVPREDPPRIAEPVARAEPARTPEPTPAPPPAQELVALPTRADVTVPTLVLRPREPATRAVILLAGGSGKVGLSAHGIGAGADNFLVRTRQSFVDAGFVVAVVDAPSDRNDGLEGFRTSAQHADDLAAIVAWLRAHEHAQAVWMVGVSRGTISAANAAARLGARGPDGLVLLSSITGGKHETLAAVALDRITVPTLLLHHRADACKGSPPSGARALVRKLSHAKVHTLELVGAPSRAREPDPCESTTRHGYAGIEADVLARVLAFIDSPR